VLPPTAAPSGGEERSGSLWADARGSCRATHLPRGQPARAVVISWAVFPSLWTDAGSDGGRCELIESNAGPSSEHIFGTTTQGCDLYAHVILGARPSIIIAVLVTAASTFIGAAFGHRRRLYGGWVDTIASRLTDVFLGLPFILGALLFLALLGLPQHLDGQPILTVLSWPPITRIMRGSVIAVKRSTTSRPPSRSGASNASIIFRHILPNSIAPGDHPRDALPRRFVSAEATLTFLGVGLEIPEISWGITIAQGRTTPSPATRTCSSSPAPR
jgi:ABC-type dipeptide/oligopeptide/nickel transport system permease subunit